MSITIPRVLSFTCLVGVSALPLLTGCSSSSPGSTSTTDSGAGSSGAPICTSSGKNAYDTYGEAAFVAVDKQIFANVTADKSGKLGDSFSLIGTGKPVATTDDLATFEGKLGAFLVAAYGGPSSITLGGTTYSGAIDLKTAHTGLGITMDQYTYFVSNIVVPALETSGVKSEDVTSCFAPVVLDTSVINSVVGQ